MHLLHSFRLASSLASDAGSGRLWRSKADLPDATSRNHSELTAGPESLEAGVEGPREGGNHGSQQDSMMTGSFLAPRWLRSHSPFPSSNGSHVPSTSDLPPSEYNKLNFPKRSLLRIHKQSSRRRHLYWSLFGLAIMLAMILLTTLLVLHHAHQAHAKGLGSTVDLGYAKYQGIATKDKAILQWRGVRYAAPPLGDLRFKAPQPPIKNDQLQKADTYGATCLPSPSTGLTEGSSEDCLFLNVYAPTDTSKTRPVFVYIQGGGFNSNSSPNMDGVPLIQAGDHDLIVVNFNYRVGPWGFLASKEVKAGGDCNAGNLDQRFVLQWVQEHIHLFGGDPNRVTLGGASAGAASVDLHLSAYGGKDDQVLFQAVTAESQSFGAQLTYEEAQYQYDGLVERTGCKSDEDTLACLRKVDVAVIAKNNAFMPTPGGGGGNPVFMYSNVIDGTFTQDYTYNLFATGRFRKVPALMGDDTNEGTIFTPKPINNYDDVNNFLKNNFPKLNAADLAEINHLYPKAQEFPGTGPYWLTAANAYGDMRYNCPGIWMSSIFSKTTGSDVWNYHWDVLSPANAASGDGVTHVAEGQAVWGLAGGLEGALNGLMTGYWQSFIRTFDPNKVKPKSSPTWDGFSSSTSKTGMQRIHFVNDPKKAAMEDIPQDQSDRCSALTKMGGALGQ